MSTEKRKPRPHPPRAQTSSSRHTSRQNLKLSEWLTVFAYIDAHPTIPQKDVVKHFATLQSGSLVFTQPTLSRKLQDRLDLEQRAHENPSALDSKRSRVVTRPDVESGIPAPPTVPQLTTIEGENSIRARRTPPALDEFLEPREGLDSMADVFEGGEAIMAKVVQEMAEVNGEVINVDSGDDESSGTHDISCGEAIHLCDRLTEAYLQHGDPRSDLAIDLLNHLRRFRVFLRRQELIQAQQTTLDHFFTPQPTKS